MDPAGARHRALAVNPPCPVLRLTEVFPSAWCSGAVFKSMHEGMPDLALPGWAETPEEFVAKHRCAVCGVAPRQFMHAWLCRKT